MQVYRGNLSRCIWMALLVMLLLLPVFAIDPLGINSRSGFTTPVSAQDGTNLSGKWQSSEKSWETAAGYPNFVMTLTQSGNQISGNYNYALGFEVRGAAVNGNQFTGKWVGGYDKLFELTIAPDGQSMTGRYMNSPNDPKSKWTPISFTRVGTGSGTTTGTGTGTSTTTGTGAALIAESRTADPNSTVQVPIRLDNASNVGSMNFVLTYNAQVLKLNKVDGGSLVSGALFTPNYKTPPQVRFGLATSDGINGSGTVAYIEFQVIGATGSSSPLTLSELDITDISGKTVTVTIQNGTVTVASEAGPGGKVLGDYNGDGKVTELDALAALKMSVKLLEQDLDLDMDKNGKVTAEDARLILKMALGK